MSTLNESLHQIMREGVMSNIHQMAQESNSAQDFIKKFNAEYGDQLWADTPDDIHAKDINQWLIDLYNDAKSNKDFISSGTPAPSGSMEESVNEGTYTTTYMGANVLPPNYGNSKLNTVAEEVYGKKFLELTDELQKKIIDLFRDQAVKRNVYESVNESTIGIQTDRSFKPADLQKALDKAKVEYKMNRLSLTLTVLNLDKKYFDDAQKVVDDLGLKIMMAKESVNERISVFDERHFGKKGIIIMIDDNGKKVSAIFKDKKNAKKFNRNKPADIKKLLQLAKKTKYPKAIDESVNEGMDKNAIRQQIAIIDKQIDTETGGFGEPLTDETLQALEIERERLQKLSWDILARKDLHKVFDESINEAKSESVKDDIYDIGGKIYKDVYTSVNLTSTDKTVRVRDFERKDPRFKLRVKKYIKSKGLESQRDGNDFEIYLDKGRDFKGIPLSDSVNESVSDFHEVVSNTMARQTAKTMIAEVANVFGVASIPKKYSKSTTIMIGYVRKCIKENKKLKRNDLIDFNQSAKMILENTSINEIMVTI